MQRPWLFALVFFGAVAAHAADSVLVFNEINYHPVNEGAQTEWIEMRSLQGVDVDIGGWKITGGVDYTFPTGTIMPGGGYIVIAAVPGQIPGAVGPFTGQLDNGGETLRLLNRSGRIMDEVSYDDEGDWSVAPDGTGPTLARRSASAASGAAAWVASTFSGGTPGGQNFFEGAVAVRSTPISIGDVWKYEDSGNSAPGGWQAVGFDDSGWKSGPTLISGGGGKLAEGAKPSAFPNGLIGFWSFDETSGTVAGNGAPGQPAGTMVNGASFVADPVRGQVASFDGTDDRMEVINPATGLPSTVFLPAMTDTNDFTWAAWVSTSTASTLADQSGSVILGNRTGPTGADTTPTREFIKIMPTAMQYHRNAATENYDYPDLVTNSWTHMCVVKRGRELQYYLNGAPIAQTRTITGPLSAALPFYVGGDRRTVNGLNEHFEGRVDDVGLWTRALSAAEIAQMGRQYGPGPAIPQPPVQTANAVAGTQPRLFRKAFSFSGTPGGAALELWPVADDGVVFYLNGVEVWRNNVPVTTELGDAAFTPTAVTISNAALVNGANVLSAEVHQAPGGNNDLLFGAELVVTAVPGPAPVAPPSLVLNEIAGATDPSFFIELRNTSAGEASTAGWTLRTSAGQSIALPPQVISAGGYAAFTAAQLGLTPADGLRLTLFAPGGIEQRDAREITNRPRGLTPDGRWGHPTTATPGGSNIVAINDSIVINEIFYNAVDDGLEQWIELHNRGTTPVDLSTWKFSDGIGYQFPPGTPPIAPGGFVVVAWDPAAFAALHPGVTAYGPFSGSLSGKGELLRLRDANDNVVDELTYADSGRWTEWADGGGSSLELRDPNADNAQAEAWEASDESGALPWQTVSYSGLATNPATGDPTTWNEFVMGLLTDGEYLIDDISVKNVTLGNVELIQNGTFSGGTAATWRIIGNHAGSVVDDPTSPGNKVLKVVAGGPTEHMHNHATTTLKQGSAFHTINPSHTYAISFRAKWLRGSNRLHTRLYLNRLARQTLLNRPPTGGTPGAVNRSRVANAGPTFSLLRHEPVVPPVGQPATVSVRITDPDGVANVQLLTSVNGGLFTSTTMVRGAGNEFSALIPGQSAGALVQFYVSATDALGATAFFPAKGPASRAMIPWQDGKAILQFANGARPHNFRILLPAADATELYKLENVMSNGATPCTVIYDERDVYYHATCRLKASEHGRFNSERVSFIAGFGGDDLFLGQHSAVSIDRSGGLAGGQAEILIKAASAVAGNIPAAQDDIIRVIAPVGSAPPAAYSGATLTGPAIFSKTRFDDSYLDNQWPNGGDGPVFKYERVYVLTQTINPITRVIDATIVPENPKIPQSTTAPPGVPVQSLGSNKEFYRWYWLIENARNDDDYTKIINTVTALGQPGGSTAFNTQTEQFLDVNLWLRATVPSALFGVTDNYLGTGGGQHNALIYFPPGGKATLIPWDLDFLNQSNPQASLTAGGDLAKFLLNPVHKRTFYGHLLDVLNRSFNSAFLTRWAQHYSRFGTEDMTASLPYLLARAQYARDVLNGTGGQTAPIPVVPFRITTAGPLTVSAPFATIAGDGWIDVAEIRLAGSPTKLAATWTDDNSFTLQLPVSAGTNTYTLQAFNNIGAQIGSASITITGTGGVFSAGPGNLVISEINFNPPGAGDLTEFVELLNVTGATLALGGAHFDEENGQGISYVFPPGVEVAPGGRLLIVRDRTEFMARYGAAGPLAPGQFTGALDNSGETLVLYAASGHEILRTTYGDSVPGTDGDGFSLVRVLSSTNPDPASLVWRASRVLGGNPGGSDAFVFAGAASADLDADGVPGLLEYAFGTSDTTPQATPARLTRDGFGRLVFTFQRALYADDVALVIEAATSPSGPWNPANATFLSRVTEGDVATESWVITPPAGNGAIFVRLKATLR